MVETKNTAYSYIFISQDRLDALPLVEEINVISIQNNNNTKHTNDKVPASDQNAPFERDINGDINEESASKCTFT